jgi:Ca2+-binding EF-hand superfamily protein
MENLQENLNDEEVEELLNFGDLDRNGEIDHKEFVKMMMAKRGDYFKTKVDVKKIE